MALPAISPLAAKNTPPGKPGNVAGNDQGPADFAAVLAHQRSGGSSAPPPPATAPKTTGVEAPPSGDAETNPPPAEQGTASSEANLPERSTVDLQNRGKMLAANGLAQEKQPAAADERGRTNALEQIMSNPGRGLGLKTATESTASLEKPGKHSDKEATANLLDGAQVPTAGQIAAPLTLPAQGERADGKLADADPLFSGSSLLRQQPGEIGSQSANAADTANPGSATTTPFSTALATQQAGLGSEALKATPPSVDTPLQSPNWGRNFGEGIVWMAKNDQQSAQININPPQLGPIQITLHLNGDQASAVFTSPHAEVRQAIQDALPQLRDQLAASGVNLGQADVGSQGSAPGREFAAQQGNQNRYGDENAILSPDTQFAEKTSSQPIHRGRGLVDLFA